MRYICDCTAHIERVRTRAKRGLFADVNGLVCCCCLLVPFTFVTTHTGPNPRPFTALHAACFPPQVLGVSRDCSERDVTRAYRKQVPPPLSSQSVSTARSKRSGVRCLPVCVHIYIRTTYNLLHVAGQELLLLCALSYACVRVCTSGYIYPLVFVLYSRCGLCLFRAVMTCSR